MANIRTARRSGFVRRGGRMVRESLWIGVTGTNTTLAAGSTAALINVTGAAILALRPITIVRSRGLLFLTSDQAAAAEPQAITLGCAVVSDQSVAIGVTALPTPTTDKDSDAWYVYQSLMASHGAGTVDSEQGQWVEYDSRAMRKMEDGFQLVYVLETAEVALTEGVVARHMGRVLVKLH